ncbi:MAG: CPBP family intramembrane metalloprotease [Chloroflexi bacterium]|nr:CPBP family intramembrane metalloprotease [Chloroflexota bacterium]
MANRVRTLLAEPILKPGHFLLALILLDLAPTGITLLIDILLGGLGDPVGTSLLISRMPKDIFAGLEEEILFRGLPLGLALLMSRKQPSKADTTFLALSVASSGLWISLHLLKNPLFQIIQLAPAALFYVNLWRGAANIRHQNLSRDWWIGAAALGTHPVTNTVYLLVWQAARFVF